MTQQDFYSLLQNQAAISSDVVEELQEIIQEFPFFPHAHILLAKAMNDSNDLQAQRYIRKAGLYAANRRDLYFLLHPEAAELSEPIRQERISHFSGNYFDLIEKVEKQGGDTKQSLKSLAERLKAAREAISQTNKPAVEKLVNVDQQTENVIHRTPKMQVNINIPTPDYFQIPESPNIKKLDITEENVKQLIKDKRFKEAIVILKELNLINPKKSIYFADQIRFLEKTILISKK